VDSKYLQSQEKNTKRKLNQFSTHVKSKVKPTGEKLLFQTLISTRMNISFITGIPIAPMTHFNCHHCLSKQNYPAFRLLDRNIVFLSNDEHILIHAAGWEHLLSLHPGWAKLKMLYDELKEEYYKKSRSEPA
jgi:hypothetical protein